MKFEHQLSEETYHTSQGNLSQAGLGSITSRCSGKWARTHPGLERAAEIEPNVGPETEVLKLPKKAPAEEGHYRVTWSISTNVSTPKFNVLL